MGDCEGAAGCIAVSLLQDPRFDSEPWLLSVWSSACFSCVYVVLFFCLFVFSGFPSFIQPPRNVAVAGLAKINYS